MLASIILYSLMLAVAVIGVRKRKSLLKELGFAETRVTHELMFAFFYLGAMILATIGIGILFNASGNSSDLSKVPEILKQISLFEVITVVLIGSFIEEIFFRGYLQKKTNLLTASFIFAYFHIIYGSFSEIIGAFFLGAILGIAYQRRNNHFAPILAHTFYNMITILALFVR
jgi:membrane protease YdiL (CAAX protease family)